MQDEQPSKQAESGRELDRTFSFGAFRFDSEGPLLFENGSAVELGPKPLAVLQCLLERPGKVVSKQHLMETVWHETFVTEQSLAKAINRLRRALADDLETPVYIQTIHRRGYRFIAPIQLDGDKIPRAGVGPAEGNLPPAGPIASAGPDATFGGRKRLGILAVFILGGIVGVWGVSLLGWQDRPTPPAASSPAQTAKLFVGAFGGNPFINQMLRYEVGIAGSATLDLILTHSSFDRPLSMAFSPAGEMFVISNRAGVTRFLDPQGTTRVLNGAIDSSNFRSPTDSVLRDSNAIRAACP